MNNPLVGLGISLEKQLPFLDLYILEICYAMLQYVFQSQSVAHHTVSSKFIGKFSR